MEYRSQKHTVIFRNRKAILTGYFDTLCLLFDMKDGKPDIGIEVMENYPKGYYCVFFMQIPVEERKQIRFEDGKPLLQDCVCSLIIDDKPNSPLLKGYVEMIGDDPIDYVIIDDHADPEKCATVKCLSCGKVYKVNRNPGYRTSFFKWSLV